MALPDPINHQEFLLTLNTSELPVVKDALPGVDIWPLFLDACYQLLRQRGEV